MVQRIVYKGAVTFRRAIDVSVFLIGGIAIRCVFPVLWTMSHFAHNGSEAQETKVGRKLKVTEHVATWI